MKPFTPDARGPLDGLTVLDMTRLVAGNMLSLQLADFGADVIKVEDPERGDPLRDWRVQGVSVHWKVYARNKKSLALKLRDAEGLQLLWKLIEKADVLMENFRPGTLEQMGLAPEALAARNPRLVLVRISGWGQDGPYKFRPGYGSLVEGMSGFAAMNGYEDRPPVLPPLALADMVAGLYGAFAVLAALRARDTSGGKSSGRGQVIDLPLLDPLFSTLGPEAQLYKMTGEIKPRTGSRSNTTSPRNVFRTREGAWISISASMQAMVERLYRALGREDMIHDPRFRTNADRVKNADATEAPLRDYIAAHTLQENMAFFEREEITAAPVYNIRQFMEDPHVKAREIVVEVPDAELGSLAMHNVVPRLSATPGALRRPAPTLGEHTAEILARVGVDAAALERLAERKVI